ncbi:MAG: virulence factor [Legionellales bacterium]
MADSENDEIPDTIEPSTEQAESESDADLDREEEHVEALELEANENPQDPEKSIDLRKLEMAQDLDDPITLVERVYQIWWHWADFHLYIISPSIKLINPPVVIQPELLPNSTEYEFVYAIHDFGSKLSASKSEDMLSAGMSMCKLYFTIEKMIFLLVERLKAGGIATDTEVQVAFGGHQLAQRKSFESIINLNYNVVVTNFDPGLWGERYLQTVKRLADKGYGYPSEAPRDVYKHKHAPSSAGVSRT